MTITVVTRWTGPADVAVEAAKASKALWVKSGAMDLRLSQIYTGPYTGQWIVAASFADMGIYAKAQAAVSASPEMKKIQASLSKVGAALQERELLIGVDI